MKNYKDYKGFDFLGYHINSMSEQILDVQHNIVEYDKFNNINYGLTFENLIECYINNLKNKDYFKNTYILQLIAGVRKYIELECTLVEYIPKDVYIKYILKITQIK